VHGDINDKDALRTILEKEKFEVVVDPLVCNIRELTNHLDIFDGKCGTYVFISSCCAFGGHSNSTISENHSMHPESKYGINKLACEEYLKSHTMKSNYLIIRPYITHGDIRIPIPFACRSIPYTVIDIIENNKPLVCFDIKNHRTKHNLMDVRDFSRIVVGLLNQGVKDSDYNVCGDHVYSWDTAYAYLYEELGKQQHLYYVDRSVLRFIDNHLYEDVIYDKDCEGTVYSGQKAKVKSGEMTDQISLKDGIRDLVQYLRVNCAKLPLEEEFNYRTDLLLVNAVKDPDDFLNNYTSGLNGEYLKKLKKDWKGLIRKYYIMKMLFAGFLINIKRKL
jgi:nucleoside-diphosphate-sugar epimerase